MKLNDMVTSLVDVAKSYPDPQLFNLVRRESMGKWIRSEFSSIARFRKQLHNVLDTDEVVQDILSRIKDGERKAMYVVAFTFKKLNLIKKLFDQSRSAQELDLIFHAFTCALVPGGQMDRLEFLPLFMDYLEVASLDIPSQNKFVFTTNELFSLLNISGFTSDFTNRLLKFVCRHRPLTAMICLAFRSEVSGNSKRIPKLDVLFGCSLLVFKDFTSRSQVQTRNSILSLLENTTNHKDSVLYGFITVLIQTRDNDELLEELLPMFPNTKYNWWFIRVFEDTLHPPSFKLVNTFVRCGYKLKRFPRQIPPSVDYRMHERKMLLWLIHNTNKIPDDLIRDRLFTMLC